MRKYFKKAIRQSLKCIILLHECYLLVHIKTFRVHRNIIVSYSILEILEQKIDCGDIRLKYRFWRYPSRISIVKTRLEYQFWRHTSRISIRNILEQNIYCWETRLSIQVIHIWNIDLNIDIQLWRYKTGISIVENLEWNINCEKTRVEYRLWRNVMGISILETLMQNIDSGDTRVECQFQKRVEC